MTIEAEHICKSYGPKAVLEDFSLSISSDSSYVLTGESGAGKTTFLRILLGLEKPDKGRIRLLGDYKYSRVNAGVVFQEDRLCENFSAVENVAMVNRRLSARIAREELEKLLPADELDKPAAELSGGMRRRVCIVRACVVPSDVIVMDEPFTGLDDENRRRCIEYIRSIQGATPLILTAHSLEGLGFCKNIPIRNGNNGSVS
jgi:ABC-type multidrug transport system ATPase subunit